MSINPFPFLFCVQTVAADFTHLHDLSLLRFLRRIYVFLHSSAHSFHCAPIVMLKSYNFMQNLDFHLLNALCIGLEILQQQFVARLRYKRADNLLTFGGLHAYHLHFVVCIAHGQHLLDARPNGEHGTGQNVVETLA